MDLLETLLTVSEQTSSLADRLDRISKVVAPDVAAKLSPSNADTIFVTRPFLPPLEAFIPLLEEIWTSRILSNNGPMHCRFESALAEYLGVEHLSLVTNGTTALTLALRALSVSGEVITTPYSFVATSHALMLTSLTPVFADIRASDFNLDPEKIEAAITPRTVAILPVHCYGNPCDTDAIAEIARRHGLPVIYDGAHAFGVTKNRATILGHGDFTTLSFHATKAFNTFEGGAVIATTAEAKRKIDRMKNFGFRDEVTVDSVGGNGKMSEFNAALGLLQLQYFEQVRQARKRVDARYRAALAQIEGLSCTPVASGVQANYSYFPIRVKRDYPLTRDALYERLKAAGIFSRRYFFPLLSHFPPYADLESASASNLPVANEAASQILCLPFYPDLAEADQSRIIELIASAR